MIKEVKSQRNFMLMECTSVAISAGIAAFLLLALLHAQLPSPAVAAFDHHLQARVHGWTSPVLTILMRAFTFVGSIKVFLPTLVVSLALLLTLGERQGERRLFRKRQVAGIFALGVGGALLLNDSFKLWFHRARPSVPWSIGDEHTYSYPSGHSLFACVLYGLIAYMVIGRRGHPLRRMLVLAIAAALVLGIGLSRIYLGMHWPTDVLAGYLTGVCWLCGTIFIDRHWLTHT